MKTLDEVIHALEVCTSGYCSNHDGDCPYLGHYDCNDEQRKLDVLHYLKEYKANQEDPDGDHQQLVKCRALLQDFYRNDPLSWDELKDMEGKPVWVEERLMIDGKERYDNRWFLVGKVTDKYMDGTDLEAELRYMRCDYAFDFPEHDHWQAYRKER